MNIATTTLGVLGIGLCLASCSARAQPRAETLTRRYAVQDADTLYVKNINGPITVTGYDGDEVKLSVTITREADNDAARQVAATLTLGEYQKGNKLVFYMDAPFIEFDPEHPEWGMQMDNWGEGYEVKFAYEIQVPHHLSVSVSTVQHGEVTVRGVHGGVLAANVNDDVRLADLHGPAVRAITVNGDIESEHKQALQGDSEYRTINGTIDVSYPQGTKARMTFDTFNGQFFTDFDYTPAPVQVVKSHEHDTEYRMAGLSGIQVGQGGPTLSFHNFNGDTYIRKK